MPSSQLHFSPRLQVAIVGSGPSGFYAVESLFAKTNDISVDMFERLPAPFGLVRYGVAPDHLKIKNVIKIYEKIAEHPQFSFFGNVTVGQDITVSELKRFYDAVIFACGAASDRRLGIPGENLLGSHTATEFVGWYNGHPDFCQRNFDLSQEVAVIIGQGNVAVDVARILSKTADELKNTDIAQHALDVLAESKIKEVHLIGRRGPAQAAFTPLEVRELGHLQDCAPVVDSQELLLNEASQQEVNDPLNAQRRKNLEILQQFANAPTSNKKRKIYIRFLRSPLEIQGHGRVQKIILEKNQLTGPAYHQAAQGIGAKEELNCGLIFRSVGYYGVPIPEVPFDAGKGIFLNQQGRIMTEKGEQLAGLYCTGWIKRGPSGVIGTNKPDSVETVESFFADFAHLPRSTITDSCQNFLKKKNVRFVTFAQWKCIDANEIARGQERGKPREKFLTTSDMLKNLPS